MRQNWLEWAILGVSAAVVVALVGFLLVDGITDEGRPPQPAVEVHAEAAYDTATGWIVPATATNTGDGAATGVVLRATTLVDGVEEESEVDIDYLPPGTDVEISFGFSAEPDEAVEVQVVAFRLP